MKKAPGSTNALIPAPAPEEEERRESRFGLDRSLPKRPDNGLGRARAAQLLGAGRRCCARPINCELAALRVVHQYVRLNIANNQVHGPGAWAAAVGIPRP